MGLFDKAANKHKNEFKRLVSLMHRIEYSALKRAGKSAVSRTNRFVREGYEIQKKWIDERITHGLEKQSDKYDKRYNIVITSKGIPLYLFKPKQLGKIKKGVKRRKSRQAGVKVRVKKKQPILIESAFLAEMEYGKQVFIRETKERGPVSALYGPQVSQLFSSDEAMNMIEREAINVFSKEFINKLEYAANKMSQG